jgi:SAM-dependent methyltransferase
MSNKYPESSPDSNIFADDRTISYYSTKASELADKYSRTDDLYSKLFVKFLSPGSNILDIGCGSGRDMSNLGKSGFIVSGADSSKEMISAAVTRYPELRDKIVLSGLPDLPGIANTVNGILCSAALQHIPDSSLYESFRSIRELLEDKGIFVISFPIKYFGIDPSTNRDAAGRIFYIRPPEKYRFLIERLGFVLIESNLQDDAFGRDAEWCVQVWK